MNPLQPATAAELGEILLHAAGERASIELGGRFTKRAMGGAIGPAGVVVSTARLDRVVDYEPRDLTISVEAGMGFQALSDLLRDNQQMLPLDPPLADRATIGGVVAANCCGPRRRLYGSARDLAIGMTFVTLEGKEARTGGMVVKNVAGLDMAKLLIGSFGTLVALTRVNFKLVPRPPEERTFLLAFDTLEAALQARDLIVRSTLQPAAIDLANPAATASLGDRVPQGWLLVVDAGGIEAVLARYDRDLKHVAREAAAREFAALESEQATDLWRRLRDFPALSGEGGPMGLRPTKGDEDAVGRARGTNELERVFNGAVLRVSTTLARLGEAFGAAPDLPALARAASGIVYIRTPGSPVERAAAARATGLYTVIESWAAPEKSQAELWADPGPELQVMSRIKQALDPDHLLNHGRLYNRL